MTSSSSTSSTQYTHAKMNTAAWVQAIVIEDEDLTFDGKSLSELYEEDRQRLSTASAPSSTCGSEAIDDEERRGRDRTRRMCHYYSKSA